MSKFLVRYLGLFGHFSSIDSSVWFQMECLCKNIPLMLACLCVCIRPFTVKASSLWVSWDAREQIIDVMSKRFLSYTISLHRYFILKHLIFLSSNFIRFTHQKRTKPRVNQCASRFQHVSPSFTIFRYRPRSTLRRKPIFLWNQTLTRGVAT